jgi:hypothetical protein
MPRIGFLVKRIASPWLVIHKEIWITMLVLIQIETFKLRILGSESINFNPVVSSIDLYLSNDR